MAEQIETEPVVQTRSPLAGLRTLASETLGQRVHQVLRNFLMEGGAQPGEKLTLRQLAAAFGTSPMPVREAVLRLAAEGALEVLPNRTVRVPLMTRSKFEEVRRIRIALEGMAIEQAAVAIEQDEILKLEALNADFAEEMRREQTESKRLFQANTEIHFTAYRAARMPVLETMIENLWLQIGPMLHYSLGFRGKQATSKFAVDSHDRMIAGLKNRDPAAAREGLVSDIMDAGDLILRIGNLPD